MMEKLTLLLVVSVCLGLISATKSPDLQWESGEERYLGDGDDYVYNHDNTSSSTSPPNTNGTTPQPTTTRPTTTTPQPTTTRPTTTTPQPTTTRPTTTTPQPTTTQPPTTTKPPPKEMGCSSYNTTLDSCKFNNFVTINSQVPCIFNCTYHPSKLSPLRLEVHLAYKHPAKNPTFITAQQTFSINSWTMPMIFPNHGEFQKYTSFESLLCPPTGKADKETIEVRITTDSESDLSMNVRLNNQSYELKMGDSVTVRATPVSPDYRLYQWTGDQSSVLISAESTNNSDSVCAILALQNAQCPLVTDESDLRAGSGRFQTFTSRAGMVARRTDYPDGIHMIFWPLPDDDRCSLTSENQSSHVVRHKSVKFQVFNHSTIASTWYIFVLTAVNLSGIIFGLALLTSKCIDRNFNSSYSTAATIEEDERELLQEETPGSVTRGGYTEGGVAFVSPGESNYMAGIDSIDSEGQGRIGDHSASGGLIGSIQSDTASSERSLLPAEIGTIQQPYSPPTTYAPHPGAMNFTSSFNPVYVMWWKRYAFFESKTAEAQVSEMGFQHNVIIMAVFATLPTAELIRSYLRMLTYHGDEDQCFFNSRCLTGAWIFHDFSRVFTNIGYIFAGVAFTHIVLRHKSLNHGILRHCKGSNSVGVSRHYGLFISLGYGLIIQGLMSSLYHTCPNSVTIRFDMMFMYVMAVAAVISVWGLRHGDVTHHVYPTMGLIGTALLMAEGREWFSRLTFWLSMSTSYFTLLITTSVLMSRYGIWSFSPFRMIQVWKGWKPVRDKLGEVLTNQDRTSTPLHIIRIAMGVFANLGLILYGAVEDPNVYNYILSVCLTNLGLYFLNYIVTKTLCFKERGTFIAWLCLGISFVSWVLAITAFSYHSTNSESSASDSRAMNSSCAFFGVYDTHDAWHILSSIALYTFFLGLLTLDDDLIRTPSKDIHVF